MSFSGASEDAEYGWGVVDAAAALAYRVAGDFTGDNVVAPEHLPVGEFNAGPQVDFTDFALLVGNLDR